MEERKRERIWKLKRQSGSGRRDRIKGEGIEGGFDPNTVNQAFRSLPESSASYTFTFQMMLLYMEMNERLRFYSFVRNWGLVPAWS